MRVRLEDDVLRVGGQRIPRKRITGVEFDRRGAWVVLGEHGVLARVDFDASERPELERIERALAPRRKSLRLFTDKDAYLPGDWVNGHVELQWPRARAIRGVRVGLIGAERTEISVSSGETSSTFREFRPLVAEELDLFGGPPVGWARASGDLVRRLLGRKDYPVLPAGRHRYEFAIPLPRKALPSFEGEHASVRYDLYARVDIPLGFDVTFNGVLSVQPPEDAGCARVKGYVDRRKGFLRADVDMKIDVDPLRWTSGERLRGRVRVTNHSAKRIKSARLRLLGIEEAHAEGRDRTVEHEFNDGLLPVPDPSAREQDIRFEIPTRGPYPYRGRHSRLDYVLELRLVTALGRDTVVQIPLESEG
jgi:hypothetical protein